MYLLWRYVVLCLWEKGLGTRCKLIPVLRCLSLPGLSGWNHQTSQGLCGSTSCSAEASVHHSSTNLKYFIGLWIYKQLSAPFLHALMHELQHNHLCHAPSACSRHCAPGRSRNWPWLLLAMPKLSQLLSQLLLLGSKNSCLPQSNTKLQHQLHVSM